MAVQDLRQQVFDSLPDTLSLPPLNLATAHELTAALLPIHGATPPPNPNVAPEGDLSQGDLQELTLFLETLRERDITQAEAVIVASGGTDDLLDRVYRETAWATRPALGEFEGEPAVTANLRFIHPEAQPDVHAAAMELCRRMAAVAPRAERIICDAIWADGAPAGLGDYRLASMRLVRRALPSPARVAWNRAQLRALTRLVAAPTETQRTSFLASAIREVADWVRRAGDFYCRAERPDAHWQALLQIRKLLTDLVEPPSVSEAQSGPLAKGSLAGNDHLYTFMVGLQRLMTELTDGLSEKPGLMAARTSDLARDALKLQDPTVWRNTSQPPITELVELERTLWQIRAVLGDAAANPDNRRTAALRFGTTSRRHSVLGRAAAAARQRAEEASAKVRAAIKAAFKTRGLEVEAVTRPSDKDEGWVWPDVEHAALLVVESIFDFLPHEATFTEIASELSLTKSLTFAPVVNGFVPPLAFTFISSLLPNNEFGQTWRGSLPFPPLPEDENLRLFDSAIDAIVAVSHIVMERDRDLNQVEADFVGILADRYSEALDKLLEIAKADEEDLLIQAVSLLAKAGQRFDEERKAPEVTETLAVEMTRTVRGELTKLSRELLVARLLLMERTAKNQIVR